MGLYIVLIKIDDTFKSKEWYTERTDERYFSDFLTQEGVDALIDKIKSDYPNSDIANDYQYGYRYHITYIILKADTLVNDRDNMWNLLHLADCTDGRYDL